MEIPCPKCGAVNWLENQSRCHQCDSVLRRCADCGNYDSGKQACTRLGGDVGTHEAQNPSLLSTSTNCMDFRYTGRPA